MSAPHILSYAQTLDGGGVERALLRLTRDWVAGGRRVTLAIGDDTGPLAAELPAGVAVVRLADRRHRAMLALPHIVRHVAPDILFCPGSHYSAVAAWTWLRLGRGCPPIVGKLSNATLRGDHGLVADAGHRAWLALQGRFLDHLVAMTPASALAAERALAMQGRVSIIPNPPVRIGAGGTAIPLPMAHVVLGVGRLVAQKRWDRLVAALVHLPGTALVILGEGPLRAALQAQARALGVADRLHLPGHVAEPLATMRAVRVLALTSDYEGVPGVLREALSVGTPVVTTDSSVAIPEIVATPALGTIIARDNPAALVAALEYWLRADAVRPAPVPQPGADAADRYLALFDSLMRDRTR